MRTTSRRALGALVLAVAVLGLAPAGPVGGQAPTASVTVVPTHVVPGQPFTITATGCTTPSDAPPIARLREESPTNETRELEMTEVGGGTWTVGTIAGRWDEVLTDVYPCIPDELIPVPAGTFVIIDVERPDTFVPPGDLFLVGTDCPPGTPPVVTRTRSDGVGDPVVEEPPVDAQGDWYVRLPDDVATVGYDYDIRCGPVVYAPRHVGPGTAPPPSTPPGPVPTDPPGSTPAGPPGSGAAPGSGAPPAAPATPIAAAARLAG